MDQKELRNLENRCIQEEPPECTAACPIHVDARALAGYMAKGAWIDAWKVLLKTMPFPRILGRICDAPCRIRCKRNEAGQAIEIGLLERCCVTTPAPALRIPVLPKKDKRVAIVGSDLDGLTAAWDLVRKGYGITLMASGDRPGGTLPDLPETLLPSEAVRDAVRELTELGVDVRLNVPLHDPDFPAELAARFDAVYLGFNTVPPPDGDAAGVFAFNADNPDIARSPVLRAAEGRRIATSIDRFIQNVSRTAGRDKEGPYPTRLVTRTDRIPPLPAVRPEDPELGYTADEAVREAGRCLQCQCLECVKVCAYLEQFGSYPKKYVREIYNNASIVMGTRQANKLINSCSLCGLCEAVCPEGFAMQTLCLEARQEMVQKGKMPPSAHEFALMDMEFSNGPRFAMARHEPGRDRSAALFFPGCQLSASSPEMVKRAYAHLRRILSGGVGLMLGCCNAPAVWAGQMERFQGEMSGFRDRWRQLGKPDIIVACSTCYGMLKTHLPEAGITPLWAVLAEKGLPGGFRKESKARPLAIHDPCTARHEPGVRLSVRALLDLMEQPREEMELGGKYTECCGFGGLMQNANPDLAKAVVRRLSEKSPSDYLTYCAGCRDNLSATGKRALHILDLIFPNAAGPDPAARKRPGWSLRQENRMRLKEELLNELWQESILKPDERDDMNLLLSPEIEQILEDRRILLSDVRKAIRHAEQSGEALLHPETGHLLAAYRPYRTMFWVEYSLSGGAIILHNAYTHRMEVAGKGQP